MNETTSEGVAVTVGGNIRRQRRKRKMSVAAFAAAIERDPSNVWRIETGRSTPGMRTIQKIAAVLDVSYLELIAGTEYAS